MLLEKSNIIYSFQNQNFHIPDSVIIKKDFYWKADDKDDQPVLEFRFKKKVLFDRLVLQENISMANGLNGLFLRLIKTEGSCCRRLNSRAQKNIAL